MAEIITLPFGMFQSCCYLIKMPAAVCLIDPSVPINRLPAGLPPIRWLMATHGHLDHICQADSIRQATGAPLWIHSADADCLSNPTKNVSAMVGAPQTFKPSDSFFSHGVSIPLESDYSIEVIHTPGHTPGCVCLLLRCNGKATALFTGDTLFAGSIGRLDLGGNSADMAQSLSILRQLGQNPEIAAIPVYPGHGPSTTLQEEFKINPYFQALEDGSLRSWLR